MWFFNNRISLKDSGIFQGFIDWHSHILPGVDDGVQTMEESLQILSRYEEMGVCEVWLTPHIMEDIPNSTVKLKKRFTELQSAYQGAVTLNLAAEYMLDHLFEQRLKNNDLLPLGKDGNHLLVETSYFNPPMRLKNILLRIKSKGYTPVLAHPERYIYMADTDYLQLKDMNVKFQLNLFSLIGLYGKSTKARSERILKSGHYNLIGSDIHSIEYFKRMADKKLSAKISSLGTINN